jgi:hypothetical protein
MYSCAADCRYTSTSLNQTICHGLPDKLSYTSGRTCCSFVSRHLPALPQALPAIVVSIHCQLCCSCAFCVVTRIKIPTGRYGCLLQSYHMPYALHKAVQIQSANCCSCVWHVQCQLGDAGFDVVCDEHKVCGSSTNASAPDGPCYCCTLELQVCLLGPIHHHWKTLNDQHCMHVGDHYYACDQAGNVVPSK